MGTKTLFTLILTMLLGFSCKSDKTYVTQVVESEKSQSFEDIYYFDYGGTLELVEDSEGGVELETTAQYLPTINPENGTLGFFPTVGKKDLKVGSDGKIRFSVDLTYSSRNDVETDVSGSNISGRKKTDFVIELVDGTLKITVTVFSGAMKDNPNSILATRVLESI